MKFIELSPIDCRKSFGGKAQAIEMPDGTWYCRSYDTIVAKRKPDGTCYVRGEYSVTTNRHVYSFFDYVGGRISNIKEMREHMDYPENEEWLDD